MKKLSYHVNPVIRKREEELHIKNMENKIRAAKSTLPGAQNKGQPGTKRQGSGRATSTGRRTPPLDAEHPAASPHDIQMIDDLIHARLEDILGQPLIQRIQSMVRGAGSNSSPADSCRSTKAMARAQSSRPAAKPPRTGRRTPWNEEWGSPGAPSSSARPVDAGGSPVSNTPPRVVRAQSLGYTPGSPYSTRAQSASPGARRPRPSGGDVSQADYGQDEDPYGAEAAPSAAAAPPPRVHLLAVPASSQSSPRPPPSSRYSAAPASGVPLGASASVLTHSDAAVIATLNPEAAHVRQPPPRGLGERPPSAGAHAVTPRSVTASPRVVADATMMSLSHLSLVNSPGGGGRTQGVGGRLSQGLRHSQLSGAVGSSQLRRPGAQAVAADEEEEEEEEEEYEDDFELVDEEELRAGDAEANNPKLDMSKLRQSVAMLNSLVQMKIQALAENEECSQSQAVRQEEGEQDEGFGCSADPAGCADGPSEALQDEELGAEWADEDTALLQSQTLMGGSAEFGQSSLLLPGDLDGGQLLQQSDLDYLERLGGVGEGSAGQTEEWGQSQDDVSVQIEAAGPVGDTAAWGDTRLPPMRRSPAATARLQRLKEERQQAPVAGGGSAVNVSQSGLAQEATALFSSLRKLHELMSGPRAVDLSPRQEDGMLSNFPKSPREEGSSRDIGHHDASSALDAPVDATLGPIVVDTDPPQSAGQDGSDGLQGQLTPKNHLCAADVEWMASLMHNLSASLQGTDLEDWLS